MMTDPTPMTREELLELAALDAFGLLDEYEAALYTRSFHHAPAAVQDEIKGIQAAFASEAALLPDTEPDPALRQRILEAVARAIEDESIELAPLAMIGRGRAGRPVTASRARFGANGQIWWRAAAFLLAGTVVVVAYFWSEHARVSNQIAELALDNATNKQLRQQIGPDFVDYLSDPQAQRIVLTSTREDVGCWANVWISERDGRAFLVFDGLPATAGSPIYALHAVDPDGTRHEVARFASRGELAGRHVEIDPAWIAVNSRWEISGPEGLLMRSA